MSDKLQNDKSSTEKNNIIEKPPKSNNGLIQKFIILSLFIGLLPTVISGILALTVIPHIALAIPIMMLINIITIVVLSLWLTDKIVHPLTKLIKGASKLGHSQESDYEINIDTQDELGLLAQTINQTAHNLNKSLQELEEERNEAKVFSNLMKLANEEMRKQTEELEISNKHLEKANKELLELDRMKSDFIAVSSHELRTPLVAIKGYNELILSEKFGPLTKKQKMGLSVSKKSIDKLTRTVNDILRISRIDTRRLYLKLEEVNIEEFINDILNAMRPLVEKRNQTIETIIESNLPPLVIDIHHIETVFHDVITNAIRFTPDGGHIIVEAKLSTINAGDEYFKQYSPRIAIPEFESELVPISDKAILFSITDTGIGIAENEYERIFERFYEVQSYKHHKSGTIEFLSGGSGLGLSITRGVLSEHGGRIWLKSELEKGTIFYFTIPIGKPRENTQ